MIYHQTKGLLLLNTGEWLHGLYAGHGAGKNNPTMQYIKMLGPLPQGVYRICTPIGHPRLGPFALKLIPHEDNEMRGRDDFWIHGGSKDPAKAGQESNGCIIATRAQREILWASNDLVLEVVE
jgi:hypothetical protein